MGNRHTAPATPEIMRRKRLRFIENVYLNGGGSMTAPPPALTKRHLPPSLGGRSLSFDRERSRSTTRSKSKSHTFHVINSESKAEHVFSIESKKKKRPNEDRYLICSSLSDYVQAAGQGALNENFLPVLKEATLHLVVDGHGGQKCAQYIVDNFVTELFTEERLVQDLMEGEKDAVLHALCEAMGTAIHQLEEKFIHQCQVDGDTSGACLVMAVALRGWLVVGNVGDCEAVVLDHRGRCLRMSALHTAACPREARRIADAGAVIRNGYIMNKLQPSRTIGDWDVKQVSKEVILAQPMFHFVRLKKLESGDGGTVLILGCDGFWDIGKKKALRYVRKHTKFWRKCHQKDPSGTKYLHSGFIDPAQALAEYAVNQGSRDDVTVIFAQF